MTTSKARFAMTVVVLLAACAPGPTATPSQGQRGEERASAPGAPKSIVIGMDEDIKNLWDVITLGGGTLQLPAEHCKLLLLE